jgi:hypothetical protein
MAAGLLSEGWQKHRLNRPSSNIRPKTALTPVNIGISLSLVLDSFHNSNFSTSCRRFVNDSYRTPVIELWGLSSRVPPTH